MMVSIWSTVFTLPHMFAAITLPSLAPAATMRRPDTANSRARMMHSTTGLHTPSRIM